MTPREKENLSKSKLLVWLRNRASKSTPTNYNTLMFRTINQDVNPDYLAPVIAQKLMPARAFLHKHFRKSSNSYKQAVEDPVYGVPGQIGFVDARTLWVDEAVTRALDDGILQVVVVAAGFDTRALRLHRPGVSFYEVDLPSVSAKKKKLLAEKPIASKIDQLPTFVGQDLSKLPLHEALKDTDFDCSRRTCFCIEGLVYYLSEEFVNCLLSSIAQLSAGGSLVYFDFLNADAFKPDTVYAGFDTLIELVNLKGEHYRSALDASEKGMSRYLSGLGFTLGNLLTPEEMCKTYLPHLAWDESKPAICPYYMFAEAKYDSCLVANEE